MREKPDLTLFIGGTRSGKSARAESLALESGRPVLYVATAESRPDDPSMIERIRRHRARRPENWLTLESPLRLAQDIHNALAEYFPSCLPTQLASGEDNDQNTQTCPIILLDCVTLWVSNILFSLPTPDNLVAFEASVRAEVGALLELMESTECRWILVSGEIGLGGIAPDQISRNYCDGLGLANQLIAARARKAFLVVAGRLLPLADYDVII